jgi:ACS family tartrate transporter-like MFS transporter
LRVHGAGASVKAWYGLAYMSEAEGSVGAAALRKASLRLVPLIGFGYGAAYMDRVNISFASISMNRDLHFSASMYGLGAGLFFVSYAICEIPSNLLLVRFGARRWLARIMLTWGVLAMGMMFVRTPTQFYTMRFLLGVAEAGFFPGVVYYLTEWFPPEYRARVISRFYIALPLSSTVMGSLAGVLLGLNGRLGLRGWQWLFLVEGLPPLILSALFYFNLPDTPAEAKWFTEDERSWLVERLGHSAKGAKGGSSHAWTDVKVALTDARILLLGFFFLCILTVLYGWAFSAPVILQELTGWSIGHVGALIAEMGLLGAVAMLLVAGHSDQTGERYWHVAVPCVVMGLAFLVGGGTRVAWIAIPAFALTVIGYNAAQGPVLALPAAFLTGRTSAVGYAAITAIGIGGGFLGPYWMGRARDLTGDYQRGLLTLAIPSLMAAGVAWWLRRMKKAEEAGTLADARS